MRLTTQSDMTRLKAIGTLLIALVAVIVSTKVLGLFALEVGGSASSQINRLITEAKPAKPELAGTTRHYRLVDGPGGPTLVPK